ncbi:MAG: hypothetical protein JSW27_17520 [Phycisphaerales bacterium]|nr:MAG: hypothetical protein JSW27_17520 [Phycisphaerales bacterium]
MILKPREKIHVIIRRAFCEDIRRHFAGELRDVENNIVRAEGHMFVHDPNTNLFVRKQHSHTRLFSLADAGNIVSVLPAMTNLKKLACRLVEKNRMVLAGGESVLMDVNEFGANR